ncbi:MAG: hypothetical protein ACJA01_000078 [Saprospiraceae bacterium]|jgi:hypothetical protein
MKPKIFLLLLLFGLSYSLQAQQGAFDRSVEFLKNDDPIGAITIMDSIIANGTASPELYSNMAKANFSTGNLAKAILFYEKGLLLDPGNKLMQQSIAAIRQDLDIQITHIPDFILLNYYRSVVNLFSATIWSTLQLLAGFSAILLLFLQLFPRYNTTLSSKTIKMAGISMLIISCLSLVFAKSKKGYEIDKHGGIVMAPRISLHQAPDKLSPEVTPIGAGNKIFIISELGEWYKVSLRDKDTGWVKKEEVAII